MRANPFRFGLIIAFIIFCADQWSKWEVMAYFMAAKPTIKVTSFFNLIFTWNPGVSFGMFNSGSSVMVWALSIIARLIVIGLTLWLYRVTNQLLATSLGLIIGGALGNLVDRVRFGAVIDFLDFHIMGYHWPTFNVADTAVTIGVGLMLLDNVYMHKSAVRTK